MNDPTRRDGPEDTHEELRKLLAGLPKVKAPGDLEARLERRIHAQEKSPFRWFIRVRRLPAIAYSLTGLLAIVFVSYLLLTRTPSTQTAVPLPAEKSTAPQPPGPQAAAPRKEDGKKDRSEPIRAKKAEPESRIAPPGTENAVKNQAAAPSRGAVTAEQAFSKAALRADSLALRDSLKADSLKRVKKKER